MMEDPSILQKVVSASSSAFVFWAFVVMAVTMVRGIIFYNKLTGIGRASLIAGAALIQAWICWEYLLTSGNVTLQFANIHSEFRSPLFLAGALENKVNGAPVGSIEWSQWGGPADPLKQFQQSAHKPWQTTLIRSTHNGHLGANNVLVKLVNAEGRIGVIYADGEYVTKLRQPGIMIGGALFADEWHDWRRIKRNLTDSDRIIKSIIGSKGLIRYREGTALRTGLMIFTWLSAASFLIRPFVSFPSK